MFIVMLNYLQPLAEVDKHLGAHREYLQEQYENGVFLASGPKEPRTGGVILASAGSREALQAILARDPFHVHGVASYELVQFTARAAAPGLEQLIGA
ncbi:YciI family protein [Massilia sp. GCM10020059]|uniref:YciI family protein n=1 Tax=Massilia agrisoli TaxID=2892444 RepID=A0ABS8IUE0_9BURK|nr:YciI family protein [Massilia agrisoli]MCC6072051.1 YciI family protein [Massilia agrisoli]